MRKTNEEFKAEVFRRRDEYYKKRNRRIRIAAVASAPLTCLTAFMIMILPAMMPASAEDPDFNPYYSATGGESEDFTIKVESETIRVNVKSISYSRMNKGTYADVPSVMEEEKVQEFTELFSFLTRKEGSYNAENATSGIITSATTTTQAGGSTPCYSITLHYEFGEPRTYFLYKDFIVCGNDEFPITQGQFKILTDFLT